MPAESMSFRLRSMCCTLTRRIDVDPGVEHLFDVLAQRFGWRGRCRFRREAVARARDQAALRACARGRRRVEVAQGPAADTSLQIIDLL